MATSVVTAIDKVPNPGVGPFRLRHSLVRAVKRSKDDDVSGMAAELAYRSALTVLPFLLVARTRHGIRQRLVSVIDALGTFRGASVAWIAVRVEPLH